jgi:hypothetical protein
MSSNNQFFRVKNGIQVGSLVLANDTSINISSLPNSGAVTGSYEDHVNEKIEEEINSKKAPIEDVSANSFPWAS